MLRRAAMRDYGIGIVAETAQGLFIASPKDRSITARLLEQGGYGQHDLALLERQMDAESSVAVLGAHIGTYLIPLARLADQVIGYEPDSNNFKLLEMNVRLNALHNVDLRCAAVGDRTGDAVFCPGGANTGQGRIDPASLRGESVEGSLVSIVRFDDDAPGTWDLIVMDLEGAELPALRGMTQAIQGCRSLLMEFGAHHAARYDWNVEDLIAILKSRFAWMTVEDSAPGAWVTLGIQTWPDRLRAIAREPDRLVNLLFSVHEPC